MSNYANLIAAIQEVVKTNGNNEVTGALLQQSLVAMINSLGEGFKYKGIATPSTNPGTPDQNVFYFATQTGSYPNFGSLSVLDGEFAIFRYSGTWVKDVTGVATSAQLAEIMPLLIQLNGIINGANVVAYENEGEAQYYNTNGHTRYAAGIGVVTPILDSNKTFNRVVTPFICSESAQTVKYAIVESSTTGEMTPTNQNVLATGTLNITGTPTQYTIDLDGAKTVRRNHCVAFLMYAPNSSNRPGFRGSESGDQYNAQTQNYLFLTTYNLDNPFSEDWSLSSSGWYGTAPILKLYYESLTTKINANTANISAIQAEIVEIISGINQTLYENVGEIAYYDQYGGNNIQRGIGGITPLLNGGAFNTLITPKVRSSVAQTVKYAIVESSTTGAMTPTNQTIIQRGTLAITTTYTQYEIKLASTHTVPANKCIAILFYSDGTSSDSRVSIKGGASGLTPYDNSQRYLFVQTTELSDPFAVSWSRASGAFVAPAPILKLIIPSQIQQEIADTIENHPEAIAQAIMPTIEGEITQLVEDEIQDANKVIFNLASKYYAVVGDTIQLFYQGIVGVIDIANYDIYVHCPVGKCYARYFEYTPVASNIGTATFTIFVRDKNGILLGQKSATIQTVAAPVSPGTAKNIFTFGDSLTANGYWPCEAARRLLNTNTYDNIQGNGINNIVFRGTKQVTRRGQTVDYFGVGGWTWKSYINPSSVFEFRFYVTGVSNVSIDDVYTNNGFNYTVAEINLVDGTGEILCTTSASTNTPQASGTLTKVSGDGDATITYSSYILENANPLWDTVNNKMSFIPYVQQCGASTIDAVFVLLTWNSMASWRNYSENDTTGHIADAKTFARTLHTEYPNAKLKIIGLQMPSLTGGLGANYSGSSTYLDRFGLTYTAISYNTALQKMCELEEFAPYCEFVDTGAQFDSLYNMPYSTRPVNTRYLEGPTERIGTNGIHPAERGYYQISDAVYRNIVANLCQ